MTGLDHSLIYQAAKLATGANSHAIYTCLYRYETAKTVKRRARYERVLRQFVATSHLLIARQAEAEFLRRRSEKLREMSDYLAQRIAHINYG